MAAHVRVGRDCLTPEGQTAGPVTPCAAVNIPWEQDGTPLAWPGPACSAGTGSAPAGSVSPGGVRPCAGAKTGLWAPSCRLIACPLWGR